MIAWPSIHPRTGQQYRWLGPDRTLMPEGKVPRVEDIPELPQAWVIELEKNSLREEVFDGSAPNRPRLSDAVIAEEVYESLTRLTDTGSADNVIAARLQKALLELTAGAGSRYETARDHVAALMRFHSLGRAGVPSALAELFSVYVMEVADTRPRQVAEAEFKRCTEGAALLIAASAPSDPWQCLGMARPDSGGGGSIHNPSDSDSGWQAGRMVTGAAFMFDAQNAVEMLWGRDDQVLWSDGEGLVLTGNQGVGKTTLAQQVVLTLIGVLDEPVLGLPVTLEAQRVLYLAMDRPRQIRRAFLRQCRKEHRHLLEEKLVIWKGPPPADLARNPKMLTELAERAQADVVVVDSLKDAALGLSEDEVGAGWNRAAQELLATGRNLMVLHHLKKQTKNTKTGLHDVYGSTWLTSGMGSVILLDGNPGDPILQFRHLKFPVAEVGPLRISHDHPTGLMTVESEVDLVARARTQGGITAQRAAELLYGKTDRSSVEKARRRLEKDVVTGKLRKRNEDRTTIYVSTYGSSPSAVRAM